MDVHGVGGAKVAVVARRCADGVCSAGASKRIYISFVDPGHRYVHRMYLQTAQHGDHSSASVIQSQVFKIFGVIKQLPGSRRLFLRPPGNDQQTHLVQRGPGIRVQEVVVRKAAEKEKQTSRFRSFVVEHRVRSHLG